MEWNIRSSRLVYTLEGRYSVYDRVYDLPNGSTRAELFIDSLQVVTVLAQDKDDVLLIRQYRPGIDRVIVDLPSGYMEMGERAEQTARRKLEEETGYRAGELIFLGSYYPEPGISNKQAHAFLARRLRLVGQEPEEDGFTEVVRVPILEFYRNVENNIYHSVNVAYCAMLARKFIYLYI
ncbi:MAG: NUDIX hydrolase [Clostridia bacterium]|jgi:8-oxo-dGTP pyrophosphatase MutT (NUDIX family)